MRSRVVALATIVAIFAFTPLAAQTKVYSNLPAGPTPPTPANVVSLGYEATATTEVAEKVTDIAGTWQLSSANLIISDWAYCSAYAVLCAANSAGFNENITISFYGLDASNNISSTLYSLTVNELVPWRAEPNVAACGSLGDFSTFHEWLGPDAACHGGEAFTLFFNLGASNLILPSSYAVGFDYSTGDYADRGNSPLGAGPWNSLNIGLNQGCSASVGIDNCVGYANTNYGPGYQTGGQLVQDDFLATNYSPLFEIDGVAPSAPPSNVTPEPATMSLMALGLVGMAGMRRRKRSR